jgi:hypothetical protein
MKRAFLTVFACLALAACGAEESETTTTSAAEPTAEPAAGGGGGGGGSPCARARDCCNAYVDAMATPGVTAEQTCAGIAAAESAGGPGVDTSCTTMITGWRTSLSAMGRDVPAACN